MHFEPDKAIMSNVVFDSVRRIYFDLDDTLCGYWDASKAALRKTFAEVSPNGHDAQHMVQEWAAAFRDFAPTLKKTGWYQTYLKEGEPTRTEQMRLTLRRIGIEDEALAIRLSEAYGRHRNDGLQLFDDAWEVLQTLHERYPMGLITNGPADIQRQEIAALGIGEFFDQVYIEGEMGRGKPLPDVFAMITENSGVAPHEILMVGNSYAHDIRPAIESGWRSVWIRRPSDVPPSAPGHVTQPEERPDDAPEPDAVIRHLEELLTLLGLRESASVSDR